MAGGVETCRTGVTRERRSLVSRVQTRLGDRANRSRWTQAPPFFSSPLPPVPPGASEQGGLRRSRTTGFSRPRLPRLARRPARAHCQARTAATTRPVYALRLRLRRRVRVLRDARAFHEVRCRARVRREPPAPIQQAPNDAHAFSSPPPSATGAPPGATDHDSSNASRDARPARTGTVGGEPIAQGRRTGAERASTRTDAAAPLRLARRGKCEMPARLRFYRPTAAVLVRSCGQSPPYAPSRLRP
jgi:hypothetical protein